MGKPSLSKAKRRQMREAQIQAQDDAQAARARARSRAGDSAYPTYDGGTGKTGNSNGGGVR